MIRRDDLDVALSYTELDSPRLVAGGSSRAIPVNHRDLLLSPRPIRHHNILFPLILTAAALRPEHKARCCCNRDAGTQADVDTIGSRTIDRQPRAKVGQRTIRIVLLATP